MRPYSQDLRERVIAAVEAAEESQEAIAARYAIHPSTLDKWWKRWRATDSVAATPQRHGPLRRLQSQEAPLRAAVAAQPDVSLPELCEQLAQKGVGASVSMMCRELQRLRLPRKKKTQSAAQQATPRVQKLRQTFVRDVQEALATLLERFHFLDETGVHLGFTRLLGRAAPGERVVESVPLAQESHYTTVAVLGQRGIVAPLVFEGAMSGVIFAQYVEQQVCPALRRGDVLVLDNLSAHKNPEVRELFAARGIRLIFLPPYSPDFNPIELCWAKVKAALRAAKARTFDALVTALADALHAITADDILAWFKHCGFAA